MKKLTADELIRRVEALEAAVDQMLGALKADLAGLRAELTSAREAEPAPPPAPPPRPPSVERPRIPSGSINAQATRKISSPVHAISEESLPPKKKDPRADE